MTVSGDPIRIADLREGGEERIDRETLLALVDAVEAAHALEAAEARGMGLGPDEHRALIARHEETLARFDFGAEA